MTLMIVDQGAQFADLERLMRSLHRIELRVSRTMGETANKLYIACSKLANEQDRPEAEQDTEKIERQTREVIELREKFLSLASTDAATSEIEAVSKIRD